MGIIKFIYKLIENILETIIIIATLIFTLVICNPLAWVGLYVIHLILKG